MQTEHKLVRIGPDFDGGYLVPNDLDGLAAVFSPGVSDTLGFDLEMAPRVGACVLADASVEEPTGMAENMKFDQKFLGTEDAGDTITLDKWVGANSQPGDDLLLQIDIEGAEYDVLNATSDEILNRFRVILIEYHHLNRVFDRSQFDKMAATVKRLAEGYVLCHVHSNNAMPHVITHGREIPPLIEATYIRRDRIATTPVPAAVPHPLDQQNDLKFDDVPTSIFWKD